MKWTDEKDKKLRELYPNISNKEIAGILGCTTNAINGRAFKLGLKKSPVFLKNLVKTNFLIAGAPYRFKKGSVPPNKGTKGVSKPNSGSFKKGIKAHNKRPIGSERINIYGYIEIKIKEPKKWNLKHRVVWEKHYGSIPKNYNVQFINGNKQDVRIENLRLVSYEENMRENSIYNYPPDLVKVMKLNGQLKRQINKLSSKEQKEYEN